MLNPILCILCLILLLSSSVKAGYSPEEMQAIQKKLFDREMKLQEARQEKMSQAIDALQKKDFDQVIRLASDIIYDNRLKGPAKAEVLALRSAAYFHKGEMVKAKEDVNTALIDDDKEARAYLIRSTIYEKEGRNDLAIADMESYLLLKPGDYYRRPKFPSFSPVKI